MRQLIIAGTIVFGLFASLFASSVYGQERVYDQGTVWNITYVRTEPGQFDAYMANLNSLYRPILDEQIKSGLITSYKIISAQPGNTKDWDLMLMIESPNWASFDTPQEELDKIMDKVAGSNFDDSSATVDRRKLRQILGGKSGQELVFK
ncbi:MAG: hypothetical protein ACR2QU_07030 [Gammaproteobacteria bacterium]